ncbi:MAG: hypothetical protein O7G83_19525 [Proteobacteria bacterium]|nr:hypothetical protein [Pseudomonadota bacterium]
MESTDSDVLIFQSCSSVDGTVERIEIGRRNGRLVPFLHPNWSLPNFLEDHPPEAIDTELLKEVCANLTTLERQTWLLILDGRSIPDIARDQGVTHVAVYERIRGKKGRRGMIRKNSYVRRWWELRQRRRKQA